MTRTGDDDSGRQRWGTRAADDQEELTVSVNTPATTVNAIQK